jgi:hypothetical protein
MSEVKTSIILDGDTVVVRREQDAQDIADWAKVLAAQPQHGRDFHHKWSLPTTQVEKFYQEYCGDGAAPAKPLDSEFWQWVHKKMKDPQYRIFWTYDPAKPFFMGYRDG